MYDMMRIALSGSSGLIGSAVTQQFTSSGHQVTRLVRRTPGPGELCFCPEAGQLDLGGLSGVQAVVHLAGENIAGRRWTAGFKSRVRDSRVVGTRVLCEALARLPEPPSTLVSASAVGFYGDRGDERLDEDSPAGRGFLPELARDWEAATEPARAAGVRVVLLRLGVVLSARGGALAKMLLPFRLGAGGVVGSGRQYWSWISLDDVTGVIQHILSTQALQGPVNAVAPHPVTNAEFTRALARVLRRPALLPMPAFAARLALGEMADALLLASARVEPRRLVETHYTFRQPTLEAALRDLL